MNIYIICPVRNMTPEERATLEEYVSRLEGCGNKCHFPPRDVDQQLDGSEICRLHREAMIGAEEVHVFWNPASIGSHFDFGMAYSLNKVIRMINNPSRTPSKSYTNVLWDEVDRSSCVGLRFP